MSKSRLETHTEKSNKFNASVMRALKEIRKDLKTIIENTTPKPEPVPEPIPEQTV